MVCKRVRGWTSGQSLPALNFVNYPPPPFPGLYEGTGSFLIYRQGKIQSARWLQVQEMRRPTDHFSWPLVPNFTLLKWYSSPKPSLRACWREIEKNMFWFQQDSVPSVVNLIGSKADLSSTTLAQRLGKNLILVFIMLDWESWLTEFPAFSSINPDFSRNFYLGYRC